MRRALKPSATVGVASAFVSQLTCLEVLGVDARRYLEAVIPLCSGSVTKLGKLRLVPLDVASARLRALAGSADVEAANDRTGDDQPTTADAALARWGLQRAGGRAR